MNELLKKRKLTILLTITGLIAGFLYWKYVGCLSGTCPLKSNWYYTVLFGMLVGYVVGDFFDEKKNKTKE